MALVDGKGCWRRLPPSPSAFAGRPALFLDRDGVVASEVGYLGRREDVALIAGAGEAIAEFNLAKVPVIVVTNQSGIARGYYDWNGFEQVQQELEDRLLAKGAHLDAVLACAYHGDGRGELRMRDHPWSKPGAGMLLDAAERMSIDLARSWIFGDRARDLEAGRAAGLAGGVHLSTGHGGGEERRRARSLASSSFEVMVAPTLLDGVRRLGLGRFGTPEC